MEPPSAANAGRDPIAGACRSSARTELFSGVGPGTARSSRCGSIRRDRYCSQSGPRRRSRTARTRPTITASTATTIVPVRRMMSGVIEPQRRRTQPPCRDQVPPDASTAPHIGPPPHFAPHCTRPTRTVGSRHQYQSPGLFRALDLERRIVDRGSWRVVHRGSWRVLVIGLGLQFLGPAKGAARRDEQDEAEGEEDAEERVELAHARQQRAPAPRAARQIP